MASRFAITVLCLVFASSLRAAPVISGVWILDGPGTESEIRLTEQGRQIQEAYDLLVDDPSLYCTPASASRVWANPNAFIKIEQTDTSLLISYELFDLRRTIPFGDESALTDMPSTRNLAGTVFPEMGSSFAYLTEDAVIIESRNHAPGYIRTSRGIPQSANTTTIEELRVIDDVLHITHTHIDNTLYAEPFVLTYSFQRVDATDVALYECTDANYDWFNELNAQ